MDDLRLSYSPRSGATPEGEIAALAAAYALALNRREARETAEGGGGSAEREAGASRLHPARGGARARAP